MKTNYQRRVKRKKYKKRVKRKKTREGMYFTRKKYKRRTKRKRETGTVMNEIEFEGEVQTQVLHE